MSDILNLAETFKRKSNEQVVIIEQELDSAMMTLNTSMTERVSESKAIINNATDSLSESRKELEQEIERYKLSIHTLIESYSETNLAHIKTLLQESVSKSQSLIESHVEVTQSVIQEQNLQLQEVLESKLVIWLIGLGVVLFLTLMLGLFIGYTIAK